MGIWHGLACIEQRERNKLQPLFNMTNTSTSALEAAPFRHPTRNTRVPSEAAQAGAIVDAELVQKFLAGEEAAFIQIMTRYQAKIFAVANSLLHNHADAEEITQDTFIRAHRNLPRFRGDSSLATWLHRIAVNLARNRYWYFFRRRRHATLSLDCPIGEDGDAVLADLMPAESADPAQESSREEFTALVATCMEKLDVPHREILVLRNQQNLSYDEIAQKLGIDPGTVKSRIARARK